MTWVEASVALRWSDSRTVWHHLAIVSNGLDSPIPLHHHNGMAQPSLMLSRSVSASLTQKPQTHNRATGPQATEKAAAERRRIGRKGKWRENREVQLIESEDIEGASKEGEKLVKGGKD